MLGWAMENGHLWDYVRQARLGYRQRAYAGLRYAS